MLQVGVKALVRSEQDHYLFLKRAKPLPDGSGIRWDIPGGRIGEQEPLMDALARELREEAGLTMLSAPKLLGAQDIFVPDQDWHVVRLTYLVQAVGPVTIAAEHQAYQWVSLAEAQKLTLDDYLQALLAEFSRSLVR